MAKDELIIYNTPDGKTSVVLYAKDGNIWLNRTQIAELFGTSKQTISHHIANILKENELSRDSVVKYYLTTARDGVARYSIKDNSREGVAEPPVSGKSRDAPWCVRGLKISVLRHCGRSMERPYSRHCLFADPGSATPSPDTQSFTRGLTSRASLLNCYAIPSYHY